MSEEIRQTLISELKHQNSCKPTTKDILVVIHNQYFHVKNCLESIRDCTKDYRLFLWDNSSSYITKTLMNSFGPHVFARSDTNWGFIRPNNLLSAFSTSEYLILLNSDTIVSNGWDEAMVGLLQNRPDVGITGYQGGVLDENCLGCGIAFGEEIDYVSGWCMCLHKSIKKKVGLFDNNLQFAYGEDSDLCLRIKTHGYKLYALHLGYVKHFGGATIKQVKEKQDVTGTFQSNHLYLKNKWNNYLKHDRVLVSKS